jgi:formylglycine-generating enzyme required for sulfatase activity
LLNVHRQPELATVFPDADWIEVRTDHERLRFGRITRPSWANAIGRDRYGLWVRLEVKGVRQRLRWIGPGRFWMGSPEDEEGRNEREGARHEVELTRGFWLFDTPCTQALWEVVMEENPSEFPGANRPVENVSWEDCQAFIEQLNEQFPDLGLRLPTEAQWEYACRTGIQGPWYDPDLEAIAW